MAWDEDEDREAAMERYREQVRAEVLALSRAQRQGIAEGPATPILEDADLDGVDLSQFSEAERRAVEARSNVAYEEVGWMVRQGWLPPDMAPLKRRFELSFRDGRNLTVKALDLSEAIWQVSKRSERRIDGLILSGMDLTGMIVIGTSFIDLRLEGCYGRPSFTDCQFDGCTFLNAEFEAPYVHHCRFSNCNFRGAVFRDGRVSLCDFWECLGEGFCFDGSQLDSTNIHDCQFPRLSLRQVRASEFFLARCEVAGADLSRARLGSRTFSDCAHIEECDLRDSLWDGAKVILPASRNEASLHPSDVDGADMSGACVTAIDSVVGRLVSPIYGQTFAWGARTRRPHAIYPCMQGRGYLLGPVFGVAGALAAGMDRLRERLKRLRGSVPSGTDRRG